MPCRRFGGVVPGSTAELKSLAEGGDPKTSNYGIHAWTANTAGLLVHGEVFPLARPDEEVYFGQHGAAVPV